MNDQIQAIQARLRQIDEYERKGLMPAAEAAAQRSAQQHKLMRLIVPDAPAPRIPWRVHAWAVVAMLVLLGSVVAYLLTPLAGLRAPAIRMLQAVAAQNRKWHEERLARERAGLSVAPDKYGRFPDELASAPAHPGAAASGPVAPLLAGRIVVSPALAGKFSPEDSLFITVRLPDDPDGLPLAQLRVEAVNLPFNYDIAEAETLGGPQRLMTAPKVVVTARVSKSGSGKAQAGDLVGTSAPFAPWASHADVTIGQAVK
ncbi:MAG TPA: hypothetical protein VF453_13455 [Burkholderiaceae bacterium]